MKSPLFEENYHSQFSGHETFPLRYGWLKKAIDATLETADEPNNKRTVFLADDAIARFGVGKNMVASIRHWATVTEVIEDAGDCVKPTAFGKLIFGPSGQDPFMEHHATMWLLHWKLCGRAIKTTWFWAFNHFGAQTFKRDDLIQGLLKLAAARGWPKASETTVRRDVECFLRTYSSTAASLVGAPEDALESPLAELGLIRTIGRRDDYQFARGPKPTLPSSVFALALNSFWERVGSTRTLSFEMIAHEPGSPGRVFLLDEAGLADRLVKLEDQSDGLFRWSETAGLRQVVRGADFNGHALNSLIKASYKKTRQGEMS